MSDYVREKVLRIPWDETELPITNDIGYDLEEQFPKLFAYGTIGKFQVAPTEDLFLDFVIDYEYGSCGDYGRTRELMETEKERFYPIFKQVLPHLENMDKVRLVEFCWYNGTDAPSYYDPQEDPFYEEVRI